MPWIVLFALTASQTPSEALDAAIAVAVHQETALQSYRARISFDSIQQFSKGARADIEYSQSTTVTDNRAGDKFRVERTSIFPASSDAPQRINRHKNSYDGREYRQLVYPGASETPYQGAVGTKSGVDHCVIELLYGLPEGGRFSQKLEQVRTGGAVEWAVDEGVRVLRCTMPLIDGGSRGVEIIDLDPRNRWQPRRRGPRSPAESKYPDGSPGPSTERRTLEYLRRDGFVLPSRVRSTSFAPSPSGPVIDSIIELKLESFEINPEIPEEEFTLSFPQGLRVLDKDRDVVFKAGVPGSERALGEPPGAAGRIIAAHTSRWGWADYRIWLAAAASFACLIAVKLWRERRPTS